jgi:signal transduction histidine kinase
MPDTIRARLLLLMLTVLLPALTAALFIIARTYDSAHAGVRQNLRGSALAMAQVIDRELARRVDVGRALASSYLLTSREADDPGLVFMHAWASGIARDLGGWIELHSATQLLLDTRAPAGTPPRPHGDTGFRLSDQAQVLPLDTSRPDAVQPPRVLQPVRRAGGELLNLLIVLPPQLLQQAVDQQQLPGSWVGAVIDSNQRVVARHPGGVQFLGRQVSPDIRERLTSPDTEGAFTSVTLDGMPSLGHYSRTPQGWAYVSAAPREAHMVADLPAAVVQVVAGALALLALAAGAALWVSRGIARAAESLKDAAQALQAGVPVLPLRPTGIAEFDAVGGTLAAAAQALGHARHDLERQVAEAVERTRQAEQRASSGQRIAALGRLTGGVAHDFNNLLGVISNSAHLIERHAEAQPALQMPVAVTLRAVQMGSHLSQQLLRFGGRQPVSPRPVDLALHLPELRELLQLVMRKAIPVTVQVQPGTERVSIDTSELELALINVALNARDAMSDGGRLQVQARNAAPDEAEGLAPGRYVLLAVTDTGVGMDEELAAQVFEPFFTTKRLGQGTGLGLSQVHGFCVQAGGTARMASTPGLGSTVSLVLPACTLAPAEPRVAGAAAPGDGLLHGVHLLLVEDSEELAEVTALLLQSYGCRVRRARNVDDALAQVAADPLLQLVLSDVVMPGGRDGVDLAHALRRSHPQLPVVLISGYSAALSGLTGFTVLRKPVAAEQLVAALVAALQGTVLAGGAG